MKAVSNRKVSVEKESFADESVINVSFLQLLSKQKILIRKHPTEKNIIDLNFILTLLIDCKYKDIINKNMFRNQTFNLKSNYAKKEP